MRFPPSWATLPAQDFKAELIETEQRLSAGPAGRRKKHCHKKGTPHTPARVLSAQNRRSCLVPPKRPLTELKRHGAAGVEKHMISAARPQF
jgi:hypothetical protein